MVPEEFHPLVSVIMPVYNAAHYISEAIQSVLNQSWQHLELIIINDGSTDGSEELILAFLDQRLKYYKQNNIKKPDKKRLN